jgi:hypothetical protein
MRVVAKHIPFLIDAVTAKGVFEISKRAFAMQRVHQFRADPL